MWREPGNRRWRRAKTAVAFSAVVFVAACGDCEDNPVGVGPFISALEAGPDMVLKEGDSRPAFAVELINGKPAGDNQSDVTWASLDPTTATVQRTSLRAARVTGVRVGATQIEAETTLGSRKDLFSVEVTRFDPCGQNFDIVREVDASFGILGFCFNALDAPQLYAGQIVHSFAGLLSIPNIPQPGNHVDFSHVGGRVIGSRIDEATGMIPTLVAPAPLALGVSGSVAASTDFVHVGGSVDPATVSNSSTLLVWAKTKDPIPLVPGRFLEYSLVLDSNRDPSDNVLLPPEFAGDWSQDGDFVYLLRFTPGSGWSLITIDSSNTTGTPVPPVEVETAVQVFFSGQTIMWAIPWDGPAPLARWTAFEHDGDFGTQGGAFSGDYHPEPGQPLEDLEGIDQSS